jgi:hypothetical protein
MLFEPILPGNSQLTVIDLLREAKIDEFEMPFSIYEDVFRFQVSIGNALFLM